MLSRFPLFIDGFYGINTKLLVAKTLKDMEELFAPFKFERVHKSNLINLDHLRRYYNRFSGEVEMRDGAILPVAQHKKRVYWICSIDLLRWERPGRTASHRNKSNNFTPQSQPPPQSEF